MESVRALPARKLMIYSLGASAALLLGALGPWVSASTMFGNFSVNGTAGDGKITLFLALVAAGVAVFALSAAGARFSWLGWVIAAAGAVSALVAVSDMGRMIGVDTNGMGSVGAGWGIILTLLAALALTALGTLSALAARRVHPPVTPGSATTLGA